MMDRYTCINFLKVIATLLVFFKHSLIVCFGYELTARWQQVFNTPAWGGVWMFLVIGGFLACNGFDKGKYLLNKKGILKYYKNRIVKILIPTWIFLSFTIMLDDHARFEPLNLIKWLICWYNGTGINVLGAGATWYVFIVMWCYFLTPPSIRILQKLESLFQGRELRLYLTIIALIFVGGTSYRIIGFYVGIDWYNWLYANILGCFDIFLIGVLAFRMVKYLPDKLTHNKQKGKVLFVLLFVLICVSMSRNIYLRAFYKLASPDLYALLCAGIIMFYSKHSNNCHYGTFHNTVNYLAPFTFMFYLWHSVIMENLKVRLGIENEILLYFSVMVLGLILTAYVAYLMTSMNNNIVKKFKNT